MHTTDENARRFQIDILLYPGVTALDAAEPIQLVIEYDPHPPVDAGHMSKASPETRKLAKELTDRSIPADQRRLVPRSGWRGFIDLIRTGK
jgi:hypothetical protein